MKTFPLLLALVGCTVEHIQTVEERYSERVVVMADESFDPVQRQAIEDAADIWTKQSHRFMVRVEFGAPKDLEHRLPDRRVISLENKGPWKSGNCGLEYTDHIYAVCTDERLKCVAVHELGHAFGLDHTEGTFMRPRYTDQCSITGSDQAWCIDRGVCDP